MQLTSTFDRLPLLKRLLRSLRKKYAQYIRPHAYAVVKRHGVLFLVNFTDWADRGITTLGVVERDQLIHLLEQIRRRQSTVFLDIGANLGTYAMFVARETACRRIVAYEPDMRVYDQLRANLLLNDLRDRIETRTVAVSDRNGSVGFEPGPDTHDVLSKVVEDGSAKVSVTAVRLDDDLPCKGERIAIKLDIEGHEVAALAGMQRTLAENDCFLQVECWPQNADAVIAAMAAQGYGLKHQIAVDHYFAKD